MKKHNHHIIRQVPPDYYQKGIQKNLFQRFWHTNKLKIVSSLMPHSPKKILDVGSASGWFISELSKKHPQAKCHGIDVYKQAISYGKKFYPHIEFRLADAHALPYKNNTFDVVISTEVLEHVDSPKEALLEIKRVLKKNGVAIIELDSGSILFSVAWYLWRKKNGKVWNDSHLHSFNVKKLEKMLNDCGFVILSKKKFNLNMAMVFCAKK